MAGRRCRARRSWRPQRAGVRAVLKLGSLGVELADVDHNGAQSQQDSAAEQDRDEDADRATLVAPELPQHRAGEAGDQVSHGMTPSAVSVSGEPRPDLPNSVAIAPIGVMNLKV